MPSSLLPHETILYNTKPLRVSAPSVSLCLVVLQTAPFCLLKPCLRERFALSLPFPLPVSSAVLYRAAPAHLRTTPSLN